MFERVISRLAVAEARIAELENIIIATSKSAKQREKNNLKKIPKNCGTTTPWVTFTYTI